MNEPIDDRIALIDLDGTAADYDGAMRAQMEQLRAPGEPPYADRFSSEAEPHHIEARRKLIQRMPGFWRNLRPLPLGFEVIDELRKAQFGLHVLTKGPRSTPNAWSEKLEWSREYIPDAAVTISGDKSLVYGRVLFDDWPAYFTRWLAVRPRGVVICLAHPWNVDYARGGAKAQPNVLRYDGTDIVELREAIRAAYERPAGSPFRGAVEPFHGAVEPWSETIERAHGEGHGQAER